MEVLPAPRLERDCRCNPASGSSHAGASYVAPSTTRQLELSTACPCPGSPPARASSRRPAPPATPSWWWAPVPTTENGVPAPSAPRPSTCATSSRAWCRWHAPLTLDSLPTPEHAALSFLLSFPPFLYVHFGRKSTFCLARFFDLSACPRGVKKARISRRDRSTCRCLIRSRGGGNQMRWEQYNN